MIYRPTAVQDISSHPIASRAGIRILVKREDLNHPFVSGNKWWKLKYNLTEARKRGLTTLLTFGGAYSNHIYATAAACEECGLKSIGVIRGELVVPLNQTLQFACDHGMELHPVSRTDYREKSDPAFVEQLRDKFGGFYLVPEGGSNALAVKGCSEFATAELRAIDFEHILLPVGTGGTMAGIICGLNDERNVIGVPALRNGEFLAENIARMAFEFSSAHYRRWSLRTSYHHGGYAKVTTELLALIAEMKRLYDLPLDRIYTAKAFDALLKEAEAGSFKRGDTVLFLHTGGLQAGNVAQTSVK